MAKNSFKLGIFAVTAVLFTSLFLVTFKVSAQAEPCPAGYDDCIEVPHWTQCESRGGLPRDCLPPAASGPQPQGCCIASGPAPSACPSRYRCVDRTTCPSGGIAQACTTGGGMVGNCCLPPSDSCPSGYRCADRTTCPSGGIAQACTTGGGMVGNCCINISPGPGSTTPYGAPPPSVRDIFDAMTLYPEEIAASFYKILLPIGVLLGVAVIIGAGYMFMTSQGQPDRVKDAKDRLTSAIVGVVFIVLSLVILKVIIDTLLK